MQKLFVVVCLILSASVANGMEVGGVDVAEEVVNESGTTLLLNGAGIRKKLFFSIYVAQLYLENRQDEVQAVMADDGARRIVMHFLYDKVGKDKLIEGWQDGFSANNSEEQLGALQAKIDEFNSYFDEDMVAGDTASFDYLPGIGTVVKIKSNHKGTIQGKDFNDALLSIWLGKEPVSSDLRKALLGQ